MGLVHDDFKDVVIIDTEYLSNLVNEVEECLPKSLGDGLLERIVHTVAEEKLPLLNNQLKNIHISIRFNLLYHIEHTPWWQWSHESPRSLNGLYGRMRYMSTIIFFNNY